MRVHRDPIAPTPEERMVDALDAFDLEECQIGAVLRLRRHVGAGVRAGRLRAGSLGPVRVHRRLAFRSAHGCVAGSSYVVLRNVATGERLRLPFG